MDIVTANNLLAQPDTMWPTVLLLGSALRNQRKCLV